MKTSRNGPSFLHIFFANDLVLFAGADPENILLLMKFFRSFVINPSKRLVK